MPFMSIRFAAKHISSMWTPRSPRTKKGAHGQSVGQLSVATLSALRIAAKLFFLLILITHTLPDTVRYIFIALIWFNSSPLIILPLFAWACRALCQRWFAYFINVMQSVCDLWPHSSDNTFIRFCFYCPRLYKFVAILALQRYTRVDIPWWGSAHPKSRLCLVFYSFVFFLVIPFVHCEAWDMKSAVCVFFLTFRGLHQSDFSEASGI